MFSLHCPTSHWLDKFRKCTRVLFQTSGRKKRKKDPNAPKRPMSAYLLFCQGRRETLKVDHPEIKGPAALTRRVGEEWTSMDPKMKAKYQAEAAIALEVWKAQKDAYDTAQAALPEHLRFSHAAPPSPEAAGKKKRKRDPNAPKKPISAYLLFCQVERAAIKLKHPGIKGSELTKKVGEAWTSLGDKAKAKFHDAFAKALEMYKLNKAAYDAGTGFPQPLSASLLPPKQGAVYSVQIRKD